MGSQRGNNKKRKRKGQTEENVTDDEMNKARLEKKVR